MNNHTLSYWHCAGGVSAITGMKQRKTIDVTNDTEPYTYTEVFPFYGRHTHILRPFPGPGPHDTQPNRDPFEAFLFESACTVRLHKSLKKAGEALSICLKSEAMKMCSSTKTTSASTISIPAGAVLEPPPEEPEKLLGPLVHPYVSKIG
jgi:hypothetical protein